MHSSPQVQKFLKCCHCMD